MDPHVSDAKTEQPRCVAVARSKLADGELAGGDIIARCSTRLRAHNALLGGTSRRCYQRRRRPWRGGGAGRRRGAGGSYGGSNKCYAEHHRATADLASALSWPGVDGGDVATTTGLAVMLRRGFARRGGLPSLNSGHWGTQGVAGKAVMLLRWRMGGSALA